MRDLADEMRRAVAGVGDLDHFAALLHEGWELKRSLGFGISFERIDEWYEAARRNGAQGGKLLGAGGGGFLLVMAPPWRHRADPRGAGPAPRAALPHRTTRQPKHLHPELRFMANNTVGATKSMILAAGLGTRLRPLTDAIPKCLVTIAGRPLLGSWVDRLADAGIREARVNTHAHAEQVRAYIDRNNADGRLHLTESFEPELLGSAGTIAANADLAEGASEIVIVYADNYSDVDLRQLLAFHRSHGDPLTMLLFRAPDPRACGIAELDEAGRVVSFVEKPREPRSNLANAGVYIASVDAYREMAAMRAFDLGFEVLPQFVGRMRGWVWDGYHLDIGTREALEKARRMPRARRSILDSPRSPSDRPSSSTATGP